VIVQLACLHASNLLVASDPRCCMIESSAPDSQRAASAGQLQAVRHPMQAKSMASHLQQQDICMPAKAAHLTASGKAGRGPVSSLSDKSSQSRAGSADRSSNMPLNLQGSKRTNHVICRHD
jgi:hypothetical protein